MMKNILPALLILLFLGSCNKQQDLILIPSDNPFEVMPSRFQQNVLIEHFSDEAKTATVENGLLIDQLKATYPHRVFAANFHENDFLETAYTSHLATQLGGLISISRGAVNRTVGKQTINGEDGNLLISPQNWEGGILQSLNQPDAPLSIALETAQNTNGNGTLNVYIAHKQAITADTRLLVYALEDNIQPLFQQGNVDGFKHNNVFKSILTTFEGKQIDLSESKEEGIIQKVSFPNINLAEYNLANLKFVAFICYQNSDLKKKQIINAQEVGFYGVHYWDVE